MPDAMIRLFEWMDTSYGAWILFGGLLASMLIGGIFGQYIKRGQRRERVRGLDHGEWWY